MTPTRNDLAIAGQTCYHGTSVNQHCDKCRGLPRLDVTYGQRYSDTGDGSPIPRYVEEDGISKVNPAWLNAPYMEVTHWTSLREP